MYNMGYHPANKDDKDIREAIWIANNKICGYCKKYIELYDLEIDHIIPKSITKADAQTREYYEKLKKDGFLVDCLENFIPIHRHENREKSNYVLDVHSLIIPLNTAKIKVPAILKELRKLKNRKTRDIEISNLRTLIKGDKNKAEKIYDYLTNEGNEFNDKKILQESFDYYIYKKSKSNVVIDGFIPKSLKKEGSCLIVFKSLTIRGCLITFNQNDIFHFLFSGVKTKPELMKRKFVLFNDINQKDHFFIQLGNNRLLLNKSELHNFCNIIDDYFDEYQNILNNIESAAGVSNFLYSKKNNGYKLIDMDLTLWNKLFEFSWEYDWNNGDSEWHIFNRNNLSIQIYNTKNNEVGIHATLFPVKEKNRVTVYWQEGFSYFYRDDDLSLFNTNQKWRADYTLDWLIEKFIPFALYKEYKKEKSFFRKKITFEGFKKNIYYNESEIFFHHKILMDLEKIKNKQMLIIYLKEISNVFNYLRNNENIILSEEVHSLNNVLAYLGKHGNDYFEILTLHQFNSLIGEIINGLRNSNLYLENEHIKSINNILKPLDSYIRKSILFSKYINER